MNEALVLERAVANSERYEDVSYRPPTKQKIKSDPGDPNYEGREQKGDGGRDSLGQYFREIRKIPLLTREQERELGERIQKGDKEALDELVTHNLRYVVRVANRYKGCGLPLNDLIQEGNIGLIKAAEKYDPTKNVKFITYAVLSIRQAIMHALAEQAGAVKLPINQAKLGYWIAQVEADHFKYRNEELTDEKIARHLNKPLEDVTAVRRAYRDPLSLNDKIKKGGDGSETRPLTYLDMIIDTNIVEPEELLDSKNQSWIEDIFITCLDPRERKILKLRFGFDGYEPKSREEIGKICCMSGERVRQIEEKAKDKLRINPELRKLAGVD